MPHHNAAIQKLFYGITGAYDFYELFSKLAAELGRTYCTTHAKTNGSQRNMMRVFLCRKLLKIRKLTSAGADIYQIYGRLAVAPANAIHTAEFTCSCVCAWEA